MWAVTTRVGGENKATPLSSGIGYLTTILNGTGALLSLWLLTSLTVFCHDLAVAEPHELSTRSHCPGNSSWGGGYHNGTWLDGDGVLPEPCYARSVFRSARCRLCPDEVTKTCYGQLTRCRVGMVRYRECPLDQIVEDRFPNFNSAKVIQLGLIHV